MFSKKKKEEEDLKAENERLRKENESLKSQEEERKKEKEQEEERKKEKKKDRKKDDDDDNPKKIRKFTIIGAFLGIIVFGFFYVGIPYFMLDWFAANYQQLISEATSGSTTVVIEWDSLKSLFERWLYAGVPVAVIGAITWACRKGGRARLFMSLILLVASICWMVYTLNFGDLSNLINITVDGSNYQFGIVLVTMMYLLILFKALKFLVIYGKYKDSRKDYLGE